MNCCFTINPRYISLQGICSEPKLFFSSSMKTMEGWRKMTLLMVSAWEDVLEPNELRELAVKNGMRSLRAEAIQLVANNKTTIDEVLRTVYIAEGSL